MSGVCRSHKDWGKERHVLESQGEFWGVSLKAEPPMILPGEDRNGSGVGGSSPMISWRVRSNPRDLPTGSLSTDVLGPFRGNAWRKFL